MKPIPTLEDLSPEYAKLTERLASLNARLVEIQKATSTIHAQIAAEQGRDVHQERISALISGVNFEMPESVRNQMSAYASERRDITDAVHELTIIIAEEHRKASRLAIGQFSAEHLECAAEFFNHIAAAARAHTRFGEMKREFMRAGIDTTSFSDFGREMFGEPLSRNDEAGYALRDAVKRGYLATSALPAEFR
jgi:hypothetical protein